MKIVPRDELLPVDEDRVIERVLSGDADSHGYFARADQSRVGPLG